MDDVDENLAPPQAVTPAVETAHPHQRRRWFQFRLRSLIVLLTIFAVGFAIYASQWRQRQREMAALRGLDATGYASSWGDSWRTRRDSQSTEVPQGSQDASCIASVDVPRWLQDLRSSLRVRSESHHESTIPFLHGNGLFGRVRTLIMYHPESIGPLSKDELQYLSVLTSLEMLVIYGRIFDQENIQLLTGYPILERLGLVGCTFEAGAFASIGQLHTVVDLDLNGSNITDDDLVALKSLTNLRKLDLSHTAVSNDGLLHLQSLPKLRRLELSGSRVTDEGVDRIREAIPNLQLLDD